MKNRTVDLHIRLTEKEASELKRKAKMCRITQSALVRILLNGYEPRQAPDERFYEAMRCLSAVGNNLNQLAKKANSLGFLDRAEYKRQAETLWRLENEIEKEFLRPKESKLKYK